MVSSFTAMRASEYHDLTSYRRNRMSGHTIDWANQPETFKRYTETRTIPLPGISDLRFAERDVFELYAERHTHCPQRQLRSLEDLAVVLFLTQTITARSYGGGIEYRFRSAASAGALYPTEIYVMIEDMEGIEDGVYHYSPLGWNLALIRSGHLMESLGTEGPAIVIIFTAIFFRSCWKYRERAYRYNLLDTGHVIENAVLALKAFDVSYRLSYDFDDKAINLLLGIDDTREVALAVLEIPPTGFSTTYSRKDLLTPPSHFKEASRTAPKERVYDTVAQIHESGFAIQSRPHGAVVSDHFILKSEYRPITLSSCKAGREIYPAALLKRRSKRNFKDSLLDQEKLSCLVSLMAHDGALVSAGLLVGSVRGLTSGFYLIEEKGKALLPLFEATFTKKMADICLHQLWLSRASVHFVFLSVPSLIDDLYGARGYRYVMMEAGRLGQRLYIGATALSLGCCGIGAFYDEEVTALLGLAEEARMLYLVAVGTTLK